MYRVKYRVKRNIKMPVKSKTVTPIIDRMALIKRRAGANLKVQTAKALRSAEAATTLRRMDETVCTPEMPIERRAYKNILGRGSARQAATNAILGSMGRPSQPFSLRLWG
jgi:hypothetical protein